MTGVASNSIPAAQVELLLETIEDLKKQVEVLRAQKKLLEEKVNLLTARRFGISSERLHPGQLSLLAGLDEPGPSPTEEDAEKIIERIRIRGRRRGAGHGRSGFPEHLPRNTIKIDPPEDERTCGCCAGSLVRIRTEVTERGDVHPARIIVNRYERGVWACSKGCEGPLVESLPPAVVPKAKWEASAYAHVAVAKYNDHLPLHRQMGIFRRHGIHFSKQSMWDLIRATAEHVRPVLDQMRRELLLDRALQADETPIRVIIVVDGGGNGGRKKRKTQTGYMWSYLSAKGDKVLFDFTISRSRAGPKEFLGKWQGLFLTDDYGGYDEVSQENEIVRAACWAHFRRRFNDAVENRPREAAEAVHRIDQLFCVERAVDRRIERLDRRALASGQPALDDDARAEIRLAARVRWSRPLFLRLLRRLRAWRKDPTIVPKSQFAIAVQYMMKSRKARRRFMVFLRHGQVPMDNNASERALRQVAVGRKNWMIAGSVRGGDAGAILYSLFGTCRVLDVNPEEYILALLLRRDLAENAEQFTPWAWKRAKEAELVAAAVSSQG